MSFVCLTYHRITAVPVAQADPYTVTPAGLAVQLEWLARHGYRGVSISQALAGDDGARPIALAFDDGCRDFGQNAWPLLRRYSFNATIFLVAGRVGQTADWPEAAGAPLLSWAEVGDLAGQGVEVAVHGLNHRAMDELDTAVLAVELHAARQMVQDQVGVAAVGLAYPYGRYTPMVQQVAGEAGFNWAVTARGGRNHPATDRFALRRTLVCGQDGRGWRFARNVRTGYAKLVEWRMDLRRIK